MTPANTGLVPCESCRNNDENREQDSKIGTGHAHTSFDEASSVAKKLASTFGCHFFVEQSADDSGWDVLVWAGCIYSILQQIDTRIHFDHVNHYQHYVGEDPVLSASGLPLEKSIEIASKLADSRPGCAVMLSRSDDGKQWIVVRSLDSEESYRSRVEHAKQAYEEEVEYIEAGAYDKSIGASHAMEQASRKYRRALAFAKGGDEAKAWKEMDMAPERGHGLADEDALS